MKIIRLLAILTLCCPLAVWSQSSPPCNSSFNKFTVEITSDSYPAETSWDIRDLQGNAIVSGGSTGKEFCLPKDVCFIFTIYDSFGDGMCCNYGNGSYRLLDANNVVIKTGGSFGESESFYFNGVACAVLPVKFDNVTAKLKQDNLEISWQTQSETNNNYFIIQVSLNGSRWTDLGMVNSKAVNGNSSTLLSYSFNRNISSITLAGLGLLGFLLLPSIRNRILRALFIIVFFASIISCRKSNHSLSKIDTLSSGTNIYVRVAQVDIDGSKTYSNTIVVKKK